MVSRWPPACALKWVLWVLCAMFFYILDDSHLTHIQPAPHHVTRIQPTDRWTTFSNKTSHWVSKIVCQVSNMQLDVKRFGCPFGAMIATWFGYSVSNTGNTVTRPWKTNQKLATNVASKFSPAFFLTFGLLGICWLMQWPKRISWIQSRQLRQLFQAFSLAVSPDWSRLKLA